MTKKILSLSTILAMLLVIGFPVVEPAIAIAADNDDVIVNQEVTSEISLSILAASVDLAPAIPGLSGGVGTGTTTFTVITNSAGGYHVNSRLNTAGGSLVGATLTTDEIVAIPATASAAWNLTDNTHGSGFGYTIDGGATYMNDGGGAAVQLDSSGSPTDADGVTKDLGFMAEIKPAPSPAISAQIYTATLTLTAFAD